MKKWQYKWVLSEGGYEFDRSAIDIDTLGAEGWEAVSMRPANSYSDSVYILMKRELVAVPKGVER